MCGAEKQKRRSCPRRFYFRLFSSDHCSSLSTLCCDWFASASAETAIDWRVDSACLLAASSLVSASVRLAEPVCSTLIRFLLKSCRICTTDRLEPSDEASVRSVVLALEILVSVALAELLSRKSVPEVSKARPRPAALKVTPLMFSVDLPVSLKVSLRSSPFKRLMPLNDASCEVVVICVMMLLYWLTRLARMVCDAGSATGTVAAPNDAVPGVAPVVTTPIVDESASLVVVKTSLLKLSRLAVILAGANAVFN